MLPIDYEDLPAGEIKRLREWFADPAYGILKDVIQAKLVTKAEYVMTLIADGDSKVTIKQETREAQQLQAALDLLGDIAQGYHGSDEGNLFDYRRVKAKLQ